MPGIVLPTVDLGFDELRERMSSFTASFDDFIERGRKKLLEEKGQFQRTMAENRGGLRATSRSVRASVNTPCTDAQWQLNSELDAIAEREIELKRQADREAQETLEVERVILEMKHKKKAKDEYKANLLSQISDLKDAIEKRKLGL